jgi:hypothetical protein
MAQVNVRVKFKITEFINRFTDSSTKADIGSSVIIEMKDMIAKGISPIRDVGRLAEYKAQGVINKARKKAKVARAVIKSGASSAAAARASVKVAKAKSEISTAQKTGYPYSVKKKYPDKQVRPVNLYLSGEMLNELSWREGSGESVEVGMVAGGKNAKLMGYHQDGNKNMEARPVIPRTGEEFVVRIMRLIKDIYSRRLAAIINASNK